MFASYCAAFAAAALLLGPKALILPAAELGVLGVLSLAFYAVTPEEKYVGK